jgi:tripartite-type tricarboxylate transporter receptor subunit TctC
MIIASSALGFTSLTTMPASAASSDGFYNGRQMTIIVSAGSSGAYTQTARVISKYFTKYIPGGPSFVVKNMPGAGHVLGTNFLYNQAPKDGSVIGTIGSAIPLHQVLGGQGVRYDASKFNWLGTTGISNQMGLAWYTTGVKTIEQAQQHELITGATGAGAGTAIFPTVLNAVIGTRFKLVLGYARNSDIDLAIERGEIESHHSFSYSSLLRSHPDWVKEHKVNFLYQVGTDVRSGVPGVPLMTDLAANDEQRQILQLMTIPSVLGRLYVAPPEVPADRVTILRAAFDSSVKDPAFIAENDKLGLDLFPLSGAEVTAMVQSLVDTPPAIIEKAKQAMTVKSSLKCEQQSTAEHCGAAKRGED